MVNLLGVLVMIVCFIMDDVNSSVRELIKCKTSDFPGDCPSSAGCTQLAIDNNATATHQPANVDEPDGLCYCRDDNYEFNNQYKNLTEYCVVTERSKRPTVEGTTMTVAAEASKQPVPSSHHIVGGILISICVVLVFFIVIIAYRKLQITQRLRNLRIPSGARASRQRRGRPFYEDVMMSNDNDDPPLI